jgi:methylmalonyl-CoA/ethylmalonyl-CoA epimerase
VTTSFFKAEKIRLNYFAAQIHKAPSQNFILKNARGNSSCRFAVEDIVAEMKRLEKEGFTIPEQRTQAAQIIS